MKPDPKRDELLQELHRRLTELYGERLDRLVLFGSHARGENRPDSDLDVLVVLNGEVPWPGREIDRMLDISHDLSVRYGQLVSLIPTSAHSYVHEQSPLFINVHREGIRITAEAE